MNHQHVDVLAFGAHPDDLELICSGTLLRLKWLGYKVGMVDMTRGERGTRGSAEIRAAEAEAAFKVLGLEFRENLDLGDMQLQDTLEKRRAVVECLRRHTPQLVLAHWPTDRHPDHEGAGLLVKQAMFLSGTANYEAEGAPHTPGRLMYFPASWIIDCNVYVDITHFYEQKLRAARCFASQFHRPDAEEPNTFLSRPEFWADLEARHRYNGYQIGVKYAEAFLVREKLRIDDPLSFFCGK